MTTGGGCGSVSTEPPGGGVSSGGVVQVLRRFRWLPRGVDHLLRLRVAVPAAAAALDRAGLVLAAHPALQQQVLPSTLSRFPVVGGQLGDLNAPVATLSDSIVGILGSLYGELGVAQAVENAMNTAWTVPKNSRPNPFKARGRSLLLLATAGVAIPGTTRAVHARCQQRRLARPAAAHCGARCLGRGQRGGVRVRIPYCHCPATVGARRRSRAIGAAVVWQLLQTFGVVYVGHVVQGASATNGVFALVLGLLAFCTSPRPPW